MIMLMGGMIGFVNLSADAESSSGDVGIISVSQSKSGLTVHDPISIDGNSNFASQAENESWAGYGTEAEPYIIENYEIIPSSGSGIYVKNTNVYFIIRNCAIHASSNINTIGIYLYNMQNGKIENVTLYNNDDNIRLTSSSKIQIINCTGFNARTRGIYTQWSSYIDILNCSIHNCGTGIEMYSAERVDIAFCDIYENTNSKGGVYMDWVGNIGIHFCNIYGNGYSPYYLGVNVYHFNSVTVNATNNWWGSSNGPGADGANNVGQYIPYTPWLTAPWVGGEGGRIPTVNITAPSDGQTVTGIVNINGTANDSENNLQSVKVAIDDETFSTNTLNVVGNSSWNATWNTQTELNGNHTIYVRSWDGFQYSNISSVEVNVYNEYHANITEVHSYYTGFFLSSISLNNKYIVNVSDNDTIDYVDFYMNNNKFRDNDGSDGWNSAEYDMSKIGLNPVLRIVAHNLSGGYSQPYIAYPQIVDIPYWLLSFSSATLETVTDNEYDNVWSYSAEYQIPDPPIDVGPINVPLPSIGGEYGLKISFLYGFDIRSDYTISISGGGGAEVEVAGQSGTVEIVVTGTWNVAGNTITWISAEISIIGTIEIPVIKYPLTVAGVGIEFGVNIIPKLGLTFTIIPSEDGAEIIPGVKITFEEVTGDLGVGIEGYAELDVAVGSIRVVIGAEATLSLKIPGPDYFQGFALRGYVTAELRALCWTEEYTWELEWSTGSKRLIASMNKNNEPNWTLTKRDYVTPEYNTYSWTAGNTNGTIIRNAYPFAKPQLATQRNGNKMLVWTHDNISKEQVKGLDIYYSFWDEAAYNWSAPYPVTDDELLQDEAQIAFDNNGDAVCVFTQLNNQSVSNTTSPADIFQDYEIAYSKWDYSTDTWSETQLVTNNSVMDCSPTLVKNEAGGLMLLWVTDNDMDIFSVDDRDICYAVWDGAEWSPGIVVKNSSVASSVSVAYHDNGNAVCVFSKDVDSNLTTFEDQEIYCCIYNGTWSQPVRLTDNAKQDVTPSIAYIGNIPSIVWITNNVTVNGNSTDILYYASIIDNTLMNITEIVNGSLTHSEILCSADCENRVITWQQDSSQIPHYAVYENNSWIIKEIVDDIQENKTLIHTQLCCAVDDNELTLIGITRQNKTSNMGCNMTVYPRVTFRAIPPEITNISCTPNIQEVHNYVNITAFISDNAMVNDVYVNIMSNSNLFGNFSMTGIELDVNGNGIYYYNTSYSDLGNYSYYIWANDTSDNQNKSDTYQFIIQDTTPPQISDVQDSMDPQEVYGYVNITCNVKDNVDVNAVKVNITDPNGGTTNISMIKIGDHSYYYNTSYSLLGAYPYYIWTNDTSGNGNKSDTKHFTIQDTTEPEISNVQAYPSIQAQNSWINISCTVRDNVAVSSVKVSITGPIGSTPLNITMIKIPGTNNYYYNTIYSIAGTYSYYIWANDTSSNGNKSTEYHFTITIAVITTVNGKAVNITGVGTGMINVTSIALPQTPPENLQYIGIQVNISITGLLTYANITIKYNDSDVAGINESKLRMYYWDGSQWQICNNTGVDTDKNIVWANVTHLTIFAPMAEKVTVEGEEAKPSELPWFYIIIPVILIVVLASVGLGIKRKRRKGKVSPPSKSPSP